MDTALTLIIVSSIISMWVDIILNPNGANLQQVDVLFTIDVSPLQSQVQGAWCMVHDVSKQCRLRFGIRNQRNLWNILTKLIN